MVLCTERLTIREYRMTDVEDALAIFSDPEVMRFCEPVYDLPRTEALQLYFIKRRNEFAVEQRQSGRVIGHLVFSQLPNEEAGIYEIGWIFHRAFWRQGYAYEASSALMKYGFAELELHKICAETIDPLKSVALMQKLGMQPEGVFRKQVRDPNGCWADVYWYAALAADT